jgi:hypothetical protein
MSGERRRRHDPACTLTYVVQTCFMLRSTEVVAEVFGCQEERAGSACGTRLQHVEVATLTQVGRCGMSVSGGRSPESRALSHRSTRDLAAH